MYLEHFKFSLKPFQQLPDPKFLYLTSQHDEALTRMQFALAIDDSFVIITGEVGSGKTTLVRKMLSDLPTEYVLAFITHTRLSDVELLQSILLEFGVRPFEMGKIEMLAEIRSFIDTQHQAKKRVIIIVDEAQNLGIDTLEELRLLTCMDSEEEKALNIILIGQPQLSQIVESPALEQLRQRCRLRFHLHRLSQKQTSEYIDFRVGIALKKKASIFDEGAKAQVYEHTRGVPRLINTLCDTSLMMTCLAKKQQVGPEQITEAVNELGWLSTETGSFANAEGDGAGKGESAVLTVTKDGEAMADYRLDETSYIVGRAEDCGIQIESKYLSRHHAIVSRIGSEWTISDLGSTNGIRVNGELSKVCALQNGDVITIGLHHMLFREAPRKRPPARLSLADNSDELMAQTFVIVDEVVADNMDEKKRSQQDSWPLPGNPRSTTE